MSRAEVVLLAVVLAAALLVVTAVPALACGEQWWTSCSPGMMDQRTPPSIRYPVYWS